MGHILAVEQEADTVAVGAAAHKCVVIADHCRDIQKDPEGLAVVQLAS